MRQEELNSQDVLRLLDMQHTYFSTQVTKEVSFRLKQLKTLKAAIKKYEAEILEALNKDLGKPINEGYMTEVGFVYYSINYVMKHLKRWMKPKQKATPIVIMPGKSYMISEPYGSVLIIGPYNYPFQLIFEPLIGAIAAGNTVVVKPSEMTPNVSKVIRKLIETTFEEQYISCVEGSVETTTSLINSPFDYIFFTGSPNVGKIVMTAAAQHLIPVTLELGGKSPVIVDESANIKEAARRIIWGKTLNAGQTCVAPDYVMVHVSVKESLIKEMKEALKNFYGEEIGKSKSFGRIVNDRHFNRIKSMIEKDRKHIVFGGHYDEKQRYIEPTLIAVESREAATMQEEIFGPVLPIMSYTNLDEAIKEINTRSKPLALYLFTTKKQVEEKVLSQISSGGMCINDTINHLVNPQLPFGGVGASGMGSYHGKASFETFSHRRSVLKKPAHIGNSISYPAYTTKQLEFIRKIFK